MFSIAILCKRQKLNICCVIRISSGHLRCHWKQFSLRQTLFGFRFSISFFVWQEPSDGKIYFSYFKFYIIPLTQWKWYWISNERHNTGEYLIWQWHNEMSRSALFIYMSAVGIITYAGPRRLTRYGEISYNKAYARLDKLNASLLKMYEM